ncbi:alpha-L-fucosidase [Mucilaginibacter yixingensis]|uniref:alpha-L-fucosidase n=1 Tax=Mucilaginibacter yixingensis TaxID=1295612 RepID=A0A2T5J661_9SPHI|nr:alpha-L-fucosidase [Mucilaginibacter yixingensis]PTQ93961.1 alpha-L-fucosidase [Mucilaginibacter yixingensis]
MKNSTRKFVLLFTSLLMLTAFSFGQKKLGNETKEQKAKRMEWWTDARFGMFIHWGLYALPARHEWIKFREEQTNEQYQKYFDLFNPDQFNPKLWAKQAKAAGMKYAVLTTKHHEGFCLFDSKYTDYKSTNTQAKRDLVKEFVDAFRAEGIKIGFYYSLLDWHHPNFPIDYQHPQRPVNITDTAAAYDQLNKNRDIAVYRKYLYNQVTELLTNYGKIDLLWLDFSYPTKGKSPGKGKDDWGSVALLQQIRKLQPNIIVNNRLDLSKYEDGADFETPEQVKPEALTKLRGKAFETCQTFSGSWGYNRDEDTWKSQRQLLDLLISSVSNGGNLILNVGPTARGEFDYRAKKALDSLADWMHANSKSIYKCTYAPDEYKVPEGCKLTYNTTNKRLYIHLYNYPSNAKLVLPGYKGKFKYAQFLFDNSELKFEIQGDDVVLKLPAKKPLYEIPVIELLLN